MLHLGGALFAIPILAFYETLVLGFLFKPFDSRIAGYAMGFGAFAVMGFLSTGLRKLVLKKPSWSIGILSLLPTITLFFFFSLALIAASELGKQSVATGAVSGPPEADSFDDFAVWLKSMYYTKNPKCPPLLTNKTSIVRLETAHSSFLEESHAFPPPKISGWYLNLDAECWAVMRSRGISPVLIAWSDSTRPRSSIVQLNLQSDVVSVELVESSELERRYKDQRSLVAEICPSSSLPESLPDSDF